MVLLSNIRQRQGRLDDALRLCSKALEFRQKTLGNRFKTCDTFYRVAVLLHERGDSASALYIPNFILCLSLGRLTLPSSLLEKCVNIAGSLPNAEGYLARAKNKMAEIYGSLGNDEEMERTLREEAEALRTKACIDTSSGGEPPDGYDALVPWMLW
jgi:tetratricopeptide (TPR) repeat protein